MTTQRKVILITGASSGIGAATARMAKAEGHALVLGARSKDKLEALAKELGEDTLTQACDVTEQSDLDALVEAARTRFGRIDAAFANAGMGGVPGGFTSGDPAHWKRMLLTNFYGVALTLRAVIPALKESRGHLLITSSVAGRRTIKGSVYGATKWGVTGIGYNVREELRDTGVRVTLIEPGMVDTPFFDAPKPDALKAEDVARAVMYAISQPESVDVHELMVLPTRQG